MQVWKFFHVRSSLTHQPSKNIFSVLYIAKVMAVEFQGKCKIIKSWKPKYRIELQYSYNQNKYYKRNPMKFLLTNSALPRSERRAGTSCLVYLVGTEPLIRYLFGWMALPVSAEVKTTGLHSKHFSLKCTENNVADFDGTKSFLWTLTNWVHFRKVLSFGK